MLFICINLLSALDFSLPVNCSHIFCAFVVTQWFCPVSIKHHSCTWLGISLLWFGTFITCITLDIFYMLFIVIVDSWNINKISHISKNSTWSGSGLTSVLCDKRPVTGHQELYMKVATLSIQHMLMFTVYSMDWMYMKLKFDSSWDKRFKFPPVWPQFIL